MIHGIGYPKFYIYDSTGVTLQTIPNNIAHGNVGSSGCISLTKRVTLNEKQPDRYDIENESPYTRTELREFLGYKYKCSITVSQEDYLKGLLQYEADQASNYVTDIYKLKAIESYANAGYKIKFTPHNDLEDIWGSQFPIWVDVKITRTSKIGRIYSDLFTMDIHGTELLNSPYPFTAFDFATLSGVSNSNQCINFDGSNDVGECTEFNCGKTHTIEFWMDQATPSVAEYVIYGNNGAVEHSISFDATKIYYIAGGSSQSKAHGGMSAGSKTHWLITRTGTAVVFYKNGVSLGSATLGADNDFYVRFVGAAGAASYLSAKLAHLRIYQSVLTSTQIAQQYNAGYGNWPVDTAAYAIWEMDGSGGTGTSSETDQSGNSKTLTLTGTPSRTTW